MEPNESDKSKKKSEATQSTAGSIIQSQTQNQTTTANSTIKLISAWQTSRQCH